MQSLRKNILSHFLLSSDLKGEIENPGFYFRKDKTSYHDLDNLLLTQGWRKYNYTKKMKKLLFQAEKELSVSGSVGGAIFKNKRKEVELTLVTFGKFKSFQSQLVDSLGRFNFKINDEYGQKIKILIQSANKSGKKKNYTITLNKKIAPPIFFDQIKSIKRVDSIINVFVEKNRERKSVEDAFQLSNTNLLDEVVLKAHINTPERIKVLKEYGEADIIITGKAIQEKEKKWSYGLYSVLLFNFPDQIEIITRGHDLYARVLNAYGPTLVVIDGIPVIAHDYSLIPNIPPSEVVSFEIIKSAKNIFNLYMTIVPNANPMSAPQTGSVIAIYTHAGKGLFGANKPVGLLHDVVPVFSPWREFYAPKYKNLTEEDWIKPDLRALIHWEPNIMSNHLGKANTTFYNADNIGEILVVVEAISNTGEIGYKEIVYEVQKEDKGVK